MSEEKEIQLSLQESQVFLNKKQKTNICNFMQNKMTVRNILIHYTIAEIFKLSTLIQTSMSHAEHCILMVVETKNFLELDFELVKKNSSIFKTPHHFRVGSVSCNK